MLPHVVSEVRLVAALERYYGLPCEPRQQHLLDRLEQQRYRWVEDDAGELADSQSTVAADDPQASRLADTSALELLGVQIEGVARPDRLVDLLLEFMARHFRRRAVLRVSGDTLRGWRAAGDNLVPSHFNALRIDLTQPSVFGGLRHEFQLYRGALPAVAAHLEFAASWSGELPEACMMWPVRIQQHLACILYGDGFTGNLDALDPALYPALAQRVARTMRRFILDRRRQSPT